MTTSSSSPQDVSSEPREHEDHEKPVYDATTSATSALLWIALIVISFLATLALLFWIAA